MASFHPGVKSLIDRVLKQQPKNEKKTLLDLKEIQTDKKLINQKLNNNCANKYALFKNLLKDRMKEKRRIVREEEEEEDLLNEEYHGVKEGLNDEGTRSTNEDNKENDEVEDDESDELDEEEEEDDDDGNDNGSDNEDFKLNLDDDDDDVDNDKKSKRKFNSKCKNSANDDDFFDCDNVLDFKNNKKLLSNEIPASIPSNQLTSNSSITIIPRKMKEYDFCDDDEDIEDSTTERHFRLYIDSSDQQKPKDDDIECISLNFENANSSLNNQNAADLSTTPKLNLSANNNESNAQQGFEEFDELAMLCSGNFKSVENKKLSFSELNSISKQKEEEESNESSMPFKQ